MQQLFYATFYKYDNFREVNVKTIFYKQLMKFKNLNFNCFVDILFCPRVFNWLRILDIFVEQCF